MLYLSNAPLNIYNAKLSLNLVKFRHFENGHAGVYCGDALWYQVHSQGGIKFTDSIVQYIFRVIHHTKGKIHLVKYSKAPYKL